MVVVVGPRYVYAFVYVPCFNMVVYWACAPSCTMYGDYVMMYDMLVCMMIYRFDIMIITVAGCFLGNANLSSAGCISLKVLKHDDEQ